MKCLLVLVAGSIAEIAHHEYDSLLQATSFAPGMDTVELNSVSLDVEDVEGSVMSVAADGDIVFTAKDSWLFPTTTTTPCTTTTTTTPCTTESPDPPTTTEAPTTEAPTSGAPTTETPTEAPTEAPTPWIDPGSAGDFCILTKSGVTTTGITTVNGDVGTSPIAATALTGFALNLQAGDSYSTSGIVNGKVYAADYPIPTPAKMTQAIYDMEAAYTAAAGAVPATETEKGGGILSGMVLEPGIYKWSTTVGFASTLTFRGSSSDRWIMQIAGTFTAGPGAQMLLTGGAKAENIFWAIAGVVAFNDGSHGEGIFLAQTMISFNAGSSLNGAALAQTAVTMIAATINCDDQTPGPGPAPGPWPGPGPGPATCIDLGTAGGFAILTKSGVTTTGVTEVNGDIGTSPIAAAALTGFALNLRAGDSHSTSGIVNGKVYAADYPSPTPAKMTRAILDMQAAYVSAAGAVPATETEKGGGNLNGMVLKPGIYKWGTTAGFDTTLTFDGSSSDVWIMQIAGTFTLGPGAMMSLTGGAKAENIFWAIAGVVAFNDDSHGEGIFLAQTMISFNARSSLNGAALAQTAVTMIATTINGNSN